MKKLILIVFLFSCSSGNTEKYQSAEEKQKTIDSMRANMQKEVNNADDYQLRKEETKLNYGDVDRAIYQLSTVFEGSPSESDVKTYMSKVLELYHYDLTEESYNKLGSALIKAKEISKGKIISEMSILRYLIKTYTPRSKDALPNDIAMAHTMLEGL